MASHTHDWSGWSPWTNTCVASRARHCKDCRQQETETRVLHRWTMGKDERGRTIRTCSQCGARP